MHNAYPVIFCDFGMSADARAWCMERGQVVSVSDDFTACGDPACVESADREAWEALYGPSVWQARRVWFKKPIALAQSPYRYTLWLDLDMEILSPLAPLLNWAQEYEVSLVREKEGDHLPRFHPDIKYNSGLMVYRKGAPLIALWAERARLDCHRFWGDDPLLSALIAEEQYRVGEIDPCWNWRIRDGIRGDLKIIHWMGEAGKAYIRKWGGLQERLSAWWDPR